SADKNPNGKGVEALLGDGSSAAEAAVIAALDTGKVGLAIVHDSIPGGASWSPALLEALKKANALIVLAMDDTPNTPQATVLFPAMHWTEKDGTVINGRGRVQRLRAAIPPVGDARVDLEVLQELARAAAAQPRVLSAAGVFRRLAAAQP